MCEDTQEEVEAHPRKRLADGGTLHYF